MAAKEAKWEAWKTFFSRYYENKLENPYEIAEYIAKMIQEGKDENLVDFCRTLTLMQLQPLALTGMILPLMHDRNLADFLYTWNLEFLICGMNYLITQENFVPVKTCLEALPTVPKVSNEISNSPLLENALKKYLELDNFDIPLAEIITYLFAHKDVSTEERKLVIRLRRHVNAMVAPSRAAAAAVMTTSLVHWRRPLWYGWRRSLDQFTVVTALSYQIGAVVPDAPTSAALSSACMSQTPS